jgi:putative membrane protein insertion efficiency factor
MSSGAASGGSPPEVPESPPPAVRGLLLLIEAYRVTLAPLIGGFCRYEPSCSRYAEEALRRHGARQGTTLALKRLARCHPFRPGGFDPVP